MSLIGSEDISICLIPSKSLNVVSTFFLGWNDVATWGNVKSTLKQPRVFQRWNLQRRATWNQCYVFQHNVNNVRQRRNNIVIFNVDMNNVDKRRNKVVKMYISKKNKTKHFK